MNGTPHQPAPARPALAPTMPHTYTRYSARIVVWGWALQLWAAAKLWSGSMGWSGSPPYWSVGTGAKGEASRRQSCRPPDFAFTRSYWTTPPVAPSGWLTTTSPSRMSIPSSGRAMPPQSLLGARFGFAVGRQAGSTRWWRRTSCRTPLPGARRPRSCALPFGPRCTSSCRLGAAKSRRARSGARRAKRSPRPARWGEPRFTRLCSDRGCPTSSAS